MKLGKLVLSVGVAAAAVLGTVDASACLRAMEAPVERKDSAPHLVASAEQSLESGKYAVATATILKKFPGLKASATAKEGAKEGEAAHLESRAMRIVALASVRSEGAFGVSSGAPEARKKANLEWSVTVLRKMNAARANDASLQADLGEALSKSAGTQKEALDMLSKLAADDLIGSPHAYAALAKLQAAAGDAQKSADAIKRCEGMTSTPAICAPKAPAAVPAKVKEAAPPPYLKGRA